MSPRKRRSRNKNLSHQELVTKGFSLKHPTKRQPKGYITSIWFGDNGRRYYKLHKMNAQDKRLFESADRRRKAGKEITFSYEPMSIMIDFINKYHLEPKKDKLGNIHITISRYKKKK